MLRISSWSYCEERPNRANIEQMQYSVNTKCNFYCSFQRCMALTTAILVGDAQEWIHDVADKASKLKVSHCKVWYQFFS